MVIDDEAVGLGIHTDVAGTSCGPPPAIVSIVAAASTMEDQERTERTARAVTRGRGRDGDGIRKRLMEPLLAILL